MSNHYTYSVPFTEDQLFRDYVTLRMTQAEIAAKYETSQKVVWLAMKKMKIPRRKAAKRNQRGDLNSSWKGGRVLQATKKKERCNYGNGYYYLKLPSHPNAAKNGYVGEHVVIATAERGRALDVGEIVHHVNLNKHDNSPGNLAITDRTTHANWHNRLEEIAAAMLSEGLVAFDVQRGYYRP